jgi:uncharacterized protein YggE
MATLTVRGRGVAHGKPDEVAVVLVASAYGETPAAAYDGAAQRARELEQVLDALEIPAERRRTASIFVHEVEELPGREAPGRFFASSRTAVTLDDAALAERLLLEAVQRAGIEFDGPSFGLSLENPARLEACTRAAGDARRRAEAYAAALDLPLGALVSAAEAGTEARPVSFGPTLEAGMPVHAGEVDAFAALDVTYELGAG